MIGVGSWVGPWVGDADHGLPSFILKYTNAQSIEDLVTNARYNDISKYLMLVLLLAALLFRTLLLLHFYRTQPTTNSHPEWLKL